MRAWASSSGNPLTQGVNLPCAVRGRTGRVLARWQARVLRRFPQRALPAAVPPDRVEEAPEMLKDQTHHPAPFLIARRAGRLCGSSCCCCQPQTQTNQNDQAPKRTHTVTPFPEGNPERAGSGSGCRPLSLWCAGKVTRIPGRATPLRSEGERRCQ